MHNNFLYLTLNMAKKLILKEHNPSSNFFEDGGTLSLGKDRSITVIQKQDSTRIELQTSLKSNVTKQNCNNSIAADSLVTELIIAAEQMEAIVYLWCQINGYAVSPKENQ